MASNDRKVLIVVKALMMGLVVEMGGYRWQLVDGELCTLHQRYVTKTKETLASLIARASMLSNEEVMSIAEQIGKGEKRSFVQQLLDAGKVTMLDNNSLP